MELQRDSGRSIGGDLVEQFKAVCRMCHGGCGTIVERVNGTIKKVIGDRANPINKGALCSKAGTASVEQLYHPGPARLSADAGRRQGRRQMAARQLG